MHFKLDPITASHLLMFFVCLTLIGSFIFAVILSIDSVCKQLYLHMHLMVFIISLFIESVIRYFMKPLMIQTAIFFSLARTVPLVAWHFTLLFIAEVILIEKCVFYVIFSTFLCLFFFIITIHEFAGLLTGS